MQFRIGLILAWLLLNSAEANTLTIGVLAFEGREKALDRWQPTADYLSQNIHSAFFRIEPLNHEEFVHAINKGALDFVLTNPAHLAQLNVRFGISRIATFVANPLGEPATHFSSTIFTRKDSGILRLRDLRGRRLAAVSESAFGGYLLARQALLQEDVDTKRDLDLVWMGFPHADVVNAVLENKADAGVVRSGVLENLAKQRKLNLNEIRILAKRSNDGFPLLHSTALYPEWPFARLPDTDVDLSRQVALALMELSPQSHAARSASGAGWTIPLSDSKVHAVLKELQVAPYLPARLTMAQAVQAYGHWLAIVGLLLAVSLIAGWRLMRANIRLRTTQGLLQKSQGELEEAIRMRTRELNKTRDQLIGTQTQHNSVRNDVDSACNAMHALYDILLREELSPQQRIDAMVEAVRRHLGSEIGLLYRVQGNAYEIRSITPANAKCSAPLHADSVNQAIALRRTHQSQDTGEWACHIACPVFVQGELHCVLEYASTAGAQNDPSVSSELGTTLLGLTAQWIAHEVQLDEQRTFESRQLRAARERFTDITAREKDVLGLLVQGNSNKLIARTLGLSPKTVEMHRANLIRKVSAKSSTELVQLAVSAKIFPEIQ